MLKRHYEKNNYIKNIGKKINSIQILKYARDLFAYFSMKVNKDQGRVIWKDQEISLVLYILQ